MNPPKYSTITRCYKKSKIKNKNPSTVVNLCYRAALLVVLTKGKKNEELKLVTLPKLLS